MDSIGVLFCPLLHFKSIIYQLCGGEENVEIHEFCVRNVHMCIDVRMHTPAPFLCFSLSK
jgi:hypothetical protein